MKTPLHQTVQAAKAILTTSAAALMLGATPAHALPVAAELSSWSCTGTCGSSAADGDVGLSPLANLRYGHVSTADSAATGVSPLQLDANSRGNGTETNGSRMLSPVFQAAAGDRLSMFFDYVSTDGKGFDDYAWARVVHAADGSTAAWLFTARSSNSSTGKIIPGGVVDKGDFDPDAVIVDFKDWNFQSSDSVDPINWSRLGGSNGACWKDNAPGCGHSGWVQSLISFERAGEYQLELGVVNWGDAAYDSGLAFDFAGLTATEPLPASAPEPGTLPSVLAALLGCGILARRHRRDDVPSQST